MDSDARFAIVSTIRAKPGTPPRRDSRRFQGYGILHTISVEDFKDMGFLV
jgi:hypothetical protein